MIGVTPEFKFWAQTDHTAIAYCNVIKDGKVVAVLDDDLYDGTVTLDNTSANLRTATVSLADPTGIYSPQTLTSLTAPFDTWIQPFRGVRKPKVTRVISLSNNQGTWTPGAHVGTKADATTGALTLA